MREQVPDFCFMAEVYWDLEWTMQQQGFDYAYDKRLYDRLREGHARPVREHLRAGLDYQDKLARFLENHDEPPRPVPSGACWNVSHFRRIPPTRRPGTATERGMTSWPGPGDARDGQRLLIAVNYASHQSQCYVRLPFADLAGRTVRLNDLTGAASYDRDGGDLVSGPLSRPARVGLPHLRGEHVLTNNPDGAVGDEHGLSQQDDARGSRADRDHALGCEDLVVRDTASLLAPSFQRSELIGLLAGAGTTFAALARLDRDAQAAVEQGHEPEDGGIMGVFQIGWIYYGLLITSRPGVAWNMLAVLINFLSVAGVPSFGRQRTESSSAADLVGFALRSSQMLGPARPPPDPGTR